MEERQEESMSVRMWRYGEWGLVVGLLAFFCLVMWVHHYLHAYSDPHNWLHYAYHFREQVLQSRWPYAFPLYLRLLLPWTGPYYIFFVNLPLLLLIFLLVGRLGAVRDGIATRWTFSGAGLCALVLVVSADAANLTRYVNPYRDPLSHALLLLALWLFVGATARSRPWRFWLPGVLVGLACSVREPSILILLPLGLYGVVEWFQGGRKFPFWLSVAVFGTGFVLALLPLVAQTWLATSQLALPPQAAMEATIVPGAHFNQQVFLSTGSRAVEFYSQSMGWLVPVAVVGLVLALRERRRVLIYLIAPAAAVYALFYSFYWIFVARYFYIVTLLLCVLAGYGLWGLWTRAARRIPVRWRPAAGAAALALLTGVSAAQLWQAQSDQAMFRVADARAFSAHLTALVPADAVVFAPRNLCELLQVVVQRESYPLPLPCGTDYGIPDLIRSEVSALWAQERPVYAAEIRHRTVPYGDVVHLRRLYDLEPVDTIAGGDFNIRGFAGDQFTLHRVVSWSQQAVAGHLDARHWPSGRGWLELDLGYLSVVDPDRTRVDITVEGRTRTITDWTDGAQILEVELADADGPGVLPVEIASDGVLPCDIRIGGGDLSEPIDLRFDFHVGFDHGWRFRGGLSPATVLHRKPRLLNTAEFLLPVPFPASGKVVMEWQFLACTQEAGGMERIAFYEGDRWLHTMELPRDGSLRSVLVDLPVDRDAATRWIRLEREPATSEDRSNLEVHRVLLHRFGMGSALDLQVGSLSDAPYIVSGFYSREGERTGNPSRWTRGVAELRLIAEPSGADMHLEIHYSTQHVPRALWPLAFAVRVDDEPVAAVEHREGGREGEWIWTGRVPAERVSREHQLVVETETWRPVDHGSSDSRELGVMLRRVIWRPVE